MAVQDLSIIYGSSGFGKISKEVESLTASATKSSSAFASLGSSIVSIGATAGAGFALSALTSEMFKVEDATASLQAITGATGQTLAFLGEQASKSGRDVQGGATAMLAGFEAIGSARPELLKNAEALATVATDAKVLAQAAGGELADNAKAVTTAMAQFNLRAGASSRIINVLAAGSLEGAAGIAELNDGLQVSGGVLNKMGTPLEDSVALLELLADNGLKGAEAGTQLRNIFATFASGELLPKESVDLMQKLGVNIEVLSSASTPTIDKLKELSKITADTAATTKIFGKESFTAATYLGDGVARFGQLSKAVTGTNVAFQQAAIRTSTTSFQLLRLKNAGIELGVKLLSAFKPLIQGAAALAEGLIGVGSAIADNKAAALIAVGAIAAYNGALIASTAATIANGIATKALGFYTSLQAGFVAAATVAQAAYITVTNALTGSITIATAAQRLLNIALASNPVGLVIAGVTALGAALYFLTDTTKKLTEVEQATADASAKVAEQFGKESANSEILFTKLKNLNPASAEAKKLRDEINTTYGTYLPNQLTEATNLEDIAKAQDLVTAALLRKIQAQVTEAKITEIVAQKTSNLLTTTDEIGKATGLTASRITSAVSEFAKLIGGRSFEEAGAIFEQFGYDASALSGAMVRLGGVSSTTAKAIEEINRAGLGDTFLDMALNAGQADAKIKALNDLFTAETIPTLGGVTESATQAGQAVADIEEKAAAAGSINALNAQLQRLQDQFDATGSAVIRSDLARQIALINDQITVLSGGRVFNEIETPFALGGALLADADVVTAQNKLFTSLAEAIGANSDLENVMQRSARASDFFAEQMAANMATAKTAALSLRETLISKLGEEAFGKLAQGLQNIQGEFMDFAATVAQSIGEAIGSGGSLADAFRNALRDLAIQVPKLAGMALLNAAATPGIGPAALPLALAGLALLGLSGIIAGATKPKDLSPSSPSIAGATPSAPQQGLGQFGERNALNFSGSTFVLEIDGEQFGARVGRVIQRGEKKRAR